MDRRSWPWKKKAFDKSSTMPSSADSSPAHSARLNHEQDLQRVLAEHARSSDEATTQWHQTGEKVRDLSEKLSAALSDITAKDKLVKQHAKVAEEAVSGSWEKAEAEAVAIKNEVDVAVQQKIASDNRAAHLDGALKECMRELRHVRQEQEEKVREAIVRKTREWDKVRSEFDAKLSDLSHQLLEARAEKNSLFKSLQERTRALSELDDAKSAAEAQAKVLQVRVEMLEKESSSMKFDMHVLNKEIAIRHDEREYTRKAADAANKQHLESVKQIAKLEAECQRLRMLMRKKLPGPAALAQMKLEADALGKEPGEKKKKIHPAKKDGSPRQHSPREAADAKSQTGSKEADVLSERSSPLEEEIKVLKDNLAKKEKELQSARLMCAKTASRLSHVEEHLEAFKAMSKSSLKVPDGRGDASMTLGVEKAPSLVSMSEESLNGDQLSSADAWASALIAELAHFKKDKNVTSLKCDLMDDFAEMERFASTVPSTQKPKNAHVGSQTTELYKNEFDSVDCVQDQTISLEDRLLRRERELEEATQNCSDLSRKLASAEEKIGALLSRNAANEAALIHLQEKIDSMLEEQNEGTTLHKGLKKAIAEISSGTTAKSLSHKSQNQPCYNSMKTPLEPSHVNSILESKSSVCKIIRLVGCLAQETGAGHGLSPPDHSPRKASYETTSETAIDPIIIDGELILGLHWDNADLDFKIRKLGCLSNDFLQGTVDAFSFISELAIVLEFVVALVCRRFDGFRSRKNLMPSVDWSQRLIQSGSGYKAEEMEEETKNMLTPLQSAENSTAVTGGIQTSGNPKQDEDIQLTKSGTNSIKDSFLKTEFDKFAALEEELVHLKIGKAEIENDLDIAHGKIDHLKAQLYEQEHTSSNLHMQLASAERSRQLAEDQLATMASSKVELESQIMRKLEEVKELHEKLEALVLEVHEERNQHLNAVAEVKDLQTQLDDADQLISTLRVQLGSTQRAIGSAEDQIQAMVSSKSVLESHVQATEAQVNQLQERIVTLESELHRTHEDNLKVRLECQNFQQQLSETEKVNADLNLKLASAKEARQLTEDKMATFVSSQSSLEAEIKAAEVDRIHLQEKLAELQSELQIEHRQHEEDAIKLQNSQQQLSEAEFFVSKLQLQLASTQSSMQLAEDQLADVASSNEKLQSQIKVANSEVTQLQERLTALQWKLQEEHRCHKDEIASLQHQLRCTSLKNSESASVAQSSPVEVEKGTLLDLFTEETRVEKEQEVATATEKLAECQRTITLLGKQLRALSLTNSFQENDYVPVSEVLQTVKSSDLQLEDARFQVKDSNSGTSSSGSGRLKAEPLQILEQIVLHSPPKSLQPTKMLNSKPTQGEDEIPAPCVKSEDNSSCLSSEGADCSEAVVFVPTTPLEARSSSPARLDIQVRPVKRRGTSLSDLSMPLTSAIMSPTSSEKANSTFTRFFSRTLSNF
ncbi:hypothetical protein O6H91_04G045900 [Diphasiastrum complanatum]|uniref:Uncharacterized protein n=2 Tax=Diphasiastrum complanatum TaxID=34168 RepID=A0ACC2DWB6_DIPCM|nr:hypothetical protein O6H91_04G045900 [Diphasiastrum complanatum]